MTIVFGTGARLTGKVAIVTGAAGGIGLAYAKALAREGAKVTIADVEDCAPVKEEIEREFQGAEVLALRTDVSDEAACRNMVAATVERFGKLDILVNNAALFARIARGPFEEIDVEDWDQVMAVNVRGPFLCAKAAVPRSFPVMDWLSHALARRPRTMTSGFVREYAGRYQRVRSEKMNNELGWRPRDLRVTLEDTIRWLEDERIQDSNGQQSQSAPADPLASGSVSAVRTASG